MTSKSKNGGDSGGRLCRKLLKRKYFATLTVNKSVLKRIKYQIVLYCIRNNKTSQKFLLTKARALALDDSTYASPSISSGLFALIIVKR